MKLSEFKRMHEKPDNIQLIDPISKRFVKISCRTGRILAHKKSDGPYKNIPVIDQNSYKLSLHTCQS